jgi:predicted dienelactone hydrolase
LTRSWIVALCTLFLVSAVDALSQNSQTNLGSPAVFKVGMAFRSFKPQEPYNWRGAASHVLVTVIWYPAADTAVEVPAEIPGVTSVFVVGSMAQNAELASSPYQFPLIVFSHGTGGTGLSIAWLGTELAKHGYVVAAVNHPGNNATEPYSAEGFCTWWERARDLSVVIDAMLADARFGSRLDGRRIGAAGFSLGGYTMIEIAGGITEPKLFKQFCASPKADDLCKAPPEFPTVFEDFDRLSKTDAEFQKALQHSSDSYRDPRVRAVFAIAPALGPAFRPATLERISIPVAIVAGSADSNVPIASSALYFAAQIPHAKLSIFPGNVAHYTFLDSCTETGRQSRPLLCRDGEGVDRDAVHAKTVDLALKFFNATLNR